MLIYMHTNGINRIREYIDSSVKDKTAIVLYSDFDVYPCGADDFTEAETCTDWNWILQRDNTNSEWQVISFGY